jgi:hypothetical protein
MKTTGCNSIARSCAILMVLMCSHTTANAQGIATWVGDRVGLGNVGRAMDNANREAKNAVPVYGQTEEAIAGAGRKLVSETAVESTAPVLKNAILASRDDALKAGAGPLPPEVIWEFNGFYSPDVLGAYWRVGQGNELSLQANSFRFGDRAAIALDTVLVFRSNSDANGVWLWAHELAHIEQYRRWGIDDFTKRYIRDYAAVEAEANRRADEFMNWRTRRMAANTGPAPMPQPQPQPMPAPNPIPLQQNGSVCITQINSCQWFGPVGWNCACASPWGLQPGIIR